MQRLKLSHRILISMLALIFFSFIAVGVTTIIRYQSKNKEYHKERLKRKDRAVVQSIKYMTQPGALSLTKQFRENSILSKISEVHKLNLNIYNLDGKLIASSGKLTEGAYYLASLDEQHHPFPKEMLVAIIKKIKEGKKNIREIQNKIDGSLEIYTVLYNSKNEPYSILNIPYRAIDLNNVNEEIKAEVLVLLKIYSFLFIMAGLIAIFLLKQITKPLKIVTKKLKNVEITKKNEPIFWPVNDELGMLIAQYNNLINELKEKAEQLAKSERQSAWKKMARQIAHEIKNPLTPMRLSVQHFKKTINQEDIQFYQKINEFTSTMIRQIDTMSTVVSAFSNFASLTKEILEKFSLEEEVVKIVDLYKKDGVQFQSVVKKCFVILDKTHLTRILNNLIQNAIQSVPDEITKKIIIRIIDQDKFWGITIKDNGLGIKKDIQNKIFEPNFTTKNSGMGLGLAMVKNIINDFNGEISFITKLGEGSTFLVKIPKSN